eukprot:CAMPEP_0114683556 /NCGR_PEP_ID=MMETSP0191-20121206/57977_1 /TAXON_ID=126664 /ORGANISM="Sorites sp." /LENGTH=228 /DNA_ID=CAMNT_0001964919 /DNA_START=140 /DNA_END=826 /DNA_ORIENTATION=-
MSVAERKTDCPPGGAVIILQNPDCWVDNNPANPPLKPQWKPTFPDKDKEKPPALSAIPDQAWTNFATKVSAACGLYWHERTHIRSNNVGLLIIFLVIIPGTAVGSMAFEPFPWVGLAVFWTFCGILVIMCFVFSCRSPALVLGKNNEQDDAIRIACQELTSSAEGAFTAEYRTEWTESLPLTSGRPQEARTMRLIAISPTGGQNLIMGAQDLQVSVPPAATVVGGPSW